MRTFKQKPLQLAKQSTEKSCEQSGVDNSVTLEDFNNPNFLPTHTQILEFFQTDTQWRDFCFNRANPVFEFLNQEYIDALGVYLESRVSEYQTDPNQPIRILEVGAGNGRLSHFLQMKLEQIAPGKTQIYAADSGEWNLSTDFPVEQIDHNQALAKYNPDIVIFSWMPYESDYTKDFRSYASVREYILIGETDHGCCGHVWETWGEKWDFEDHDQKPYQKDSFERFDLQDLGRLQICRTDQLLDWRHSKTVSFRRQAKLTPLKKTKKTTVNLDSTVEDLINTSNHTRSIIFEILNVFKKIT